LFHPREFFRHSMERRGPLLAFGLCGIIGVLVDIDHLIALSIWGHIGTEITNGRFWHTPLFIISCIGICYLGAYLRGLYPKLVLIGVVMLTISVLVFSPHIAWTLR